MVNEMLHPGEVGVAGRRHTEGPANVLAQFVATPVADIERRIGQNPIKLLVSVQIVGESVGMSRAQVDVDTTDRHIHLTQPPGRRIGFLAKDGNIADSAAVSLDKRLALDEHAAAAATRIIDTVSLVGLDHFDQQADHAARRIELAAAFALGAGEPAEEIFIDAAQDIFGPAFGIADVDGRNQVHQLAQTGLVQVRPGIVLRQYADQRFVFFLDGDHGIVDDFADRCLSGLRLDVGPARLFGQPEYPQRLVFVAVFRVSQFFGGDGRIGFFEGVADVFQKDQAEHRMLVFGRVHVVAHFIRSQPQGLLKSDIGGCRIAVAISHAQGTSLLFASDPS